MANEAIPLFEDADELTGYCTAAVTGKRFVQITGNRRGTVSGSGIDIGLDTGASGQNFQVGLPSAAGAAGAGKAALGVAAFDAAQAGLVTIHREGIFPVTCAADVTAGQEVEINAAGQVIPHAAGIVVGLCVISALNGNDCYVLLYEGHGGSVDIAQQAAPAALVDNTGSAAAAGTFKLVRADTLANNAADSNDNFHVTQLALTALYLLLHNAKVTT